MMEPKCATPDAHGHEETLYRNALINTLELDLRNEIAVLRHKMAWAFVLEGTCPGAGKV